MSLLCTVEIRDPDRRAVTIRHLADDACAAAVVDDMDHYLTILEHPVPAGAAINAYGGLVRTDDAGAPQPRQDRADLGIEARHGALEGGVERALADRQPEQLQQQAAEPTVANRLGEPQIHRQCHDVKTERCARLQTFGQRCQCGAATARAVTGVALHPRHYRHDRWQFDLVEACGPRLVALVQRALKVPATYRTGAHGRVGIRHQCPTAARAAQTALARAFTLELVLPIRLLAVRGRQAGVVRRLGRLTELCLQLRHPRYQRLDLRPKRSDQRVLLVMRQETEVGELGHPKLESCPPWSRQWP